jgi:hypothetical protein
MEKFGSLDSSAKTKNPGVDGADSTQSHLGGNWHPGQFADICFMIATASIAPRFAS